MAVGGGTVVVLAILVMLGTGGRVTVGKAADVSRPHVRATPPGPYALDPAFFASGSCEAYPPTHGDRHETVFLDAGHGGLDPGAVGTTESGTPVAEADETLPVELDAMALLRADGFRVVVSRTGPSTVVKLGPQDVSGQILSLVGAHDDVAARDVCADDAGASALVGIYFDAGSSPSESGSITAYDPDRAFASQSLTLANLVQTDVLADMDAQGWAIPDDGVQSDSQLGSVSGDPASGGLAAEAASYGHLMLLGPAMPGYFTTPSTMPGAVIEPLYLTDPFEGTIAASTAGQQAIAQGIASAVAQFLAPAPSTASPTT
jgi:N-acetylmuramoyl-L-alanine amidase